MRLAMVLSTAMVSAITPLYAFNHGLRETIPLLIILVLAIIGSVVLDD